MSDAAKDNRRAPVEADRNRVDSILVGARTIPGGPAMVDRVESNTVDDGANGNRGRRYHRLKTGVDIAVCIDISDGRESSPVSETRAGPEEN
jgi:hypothetical protein